jgi:hypothetical protein
MRPLARIALVALAAVLPLSALAQPTPSVPSLSAAEVSRLNAGEILVAVIPGELPVGDALGVLDAPPEQVLEVIRDFPRHSEFMRDMALSEIVGQEGEFTLQHGITDTPWPMADREWTLRTWSGPLEVDGVDCLISRWAYIPGSGNLVDTQGYWLLIPWGDDGSKTLMRYHIMVDLGTWLPNFLLEWSTENLLPERINGIRSQLGRPSL